MDVISLPWCNFSEKDIWILVVQMSVITIELDDALYDWESICYILFGLDWIKLDGIESDRIGWTIGCISIIYHSHCRILCVFVFVFVFVSLTVCLPVHPTDHIILAERCTRSTMYTEHWTLNTILKVYLHMDYQKRKVEFEIPAGIPLLHFNRTKFPQTFSHTTWHHLPLDNPSFPINSSSSLRFYLSLSLSLYFFLYSFLPFFFLLSIHFSCQQAGTQIADSRE